jgi:hypothetical protein
VNRLLPLVWLLLAPAALARPIEEGDAAGKAFSDALDRMKSVSDSLTEYTVRFYKREYVGGELLPQEIIDIHYRRPWDVVMRWVGGNHLGRVLLYRGPDWNSGRFVVDPGPMLPVISLDPTSRLAMAGGRHSLYDLPITEVVAKFVRDAEKVEQHATWTADVVDEGPTTIQGQAAHCFITTVPKEEDSTFYAKRVRTCVSKATGLPSSFRAWDLIDGALVLVEEYDYSAFDLSPGFTDAHFDRDALGL